MTSKTAKPGERGAASIDRDQSVVETTSETTETEEREAEAADISQGVVFDILRNERRRRVLEYLDGRDDQVTIGELAERLAAIENDKPESQITSQERKRLYVGLYQCHLPRMGDAGAIEFDSNRGTVEPTPHTASFLDHLPGDDTAPDAGRPWPLYYLSIAAGATGVLLADLAGLLPALLTTQVVLAVVVAAVGLCAFYHSTSDAVDTPLSSE